MKVVVAIMLMMVAVCTAGCKKNDDSDNWGGNSNSEVSVITYQPQDITPTSALCGGAAIVTSGLLLTEIGVCWSTECNPTVNDAHLSTIVWNEPFVCTITRLEYGTTYHVRAYALCGLKYYYGSDKSFTTEDNVGGGTHTWVDLGLPSGTLWATCNVGATTPEGYGDYFAWGETLPKDTYTWSTYLYCNGNWNTLNKYCYDSIFGYDGFTDNLTALLPEDDAATVNWGAGWRIPSMEEWQELLCNTTYDWTMLNDVNGILFTASNGNSLFLPAAGYRWSSDLHAVGSLGYYWLNSLDIAGSDYAKIFYFKWGDNNVYGSNLRSTGFSVRPVLEH